MDLCECHMLLAAVYYKSGEKDRMCRELETALALAKKYRYIRLLADEGACMVQMLFIYQRERGADDFTDRIMELAGGVSRYFPQLSEVSGGVLRDVDRDGEKGAAPDGAGHEQ